MKKSKRMTRRAYLLGSNGSAYTGLPILDYAVTDVARFETVLQGSLAAFDQVILGDPKRSATSCLAEFERLAAGCNSDDSLLFYFSGHGHNPQGSLFLLIDDSMPDCPVTTMIPIDSIKAIMAHSKARVKMLILDCCHSGAAGPDSIKSGGRPEQLALVGAAKDSASIIIAACGRNTVTREDSCYGGGFLTNLLVRAMSAEFDSADMDGDGLLSITDFVDWANSQAAVENLSRFQSGHDRIEAPALYGDFRSQVYLTVGRFIVRDAELYEIIREGTESISEAFRRSKNIEHAKLQLLARPIKAVAPTLTRLEILDELLERKDDAGVFVCATILQVRRDPLYMDKLIKLIDGNYRAAAIWRALRAIRDTISRYELSSTGKADLISRLKRTSERWVPYNEGITSMIQQVVKRLKVQPSEVFTAKQLTLLNGPSKQATLS